MIAIEEVVCYTSQDRGHAIPIDQRGEAPGSARRQVEQGESMGVRLHGGFPGEAWARQGKQVWNRLV